MLAADFGETFKNFFMTGNNLYIVIAVAVAIVALIVIIVVSAPKKKNKPSDTSETGAETTENDAEIAAESESSDENPAKLPEGENGVAAISTATDTETKEKVSEKKDSEKNAEKMNAAGDKDKLKPSRQTQKKTEETPSASKNEKEEPKADSEKSEKTVSAKQRVKKTEKTVKPEDETAASAAASELSDEEYEADPELTEEDGKETRPGTVEIYKDARGEFHFRFRSMNGSIVGHSQSYKSKESCKNGIRSVINCCEDVIIADTTKKDSDYVQTIGRAAFEIYRDNAGQFRYRLVAKNASNVLASQGYTNKTNCIKGAESIIRMSKNHIIDDETLKRKPDAE